VVRTIYQLSDLHGAHFNSDLIAEHQLPRSGIEHVVDMMAFPSSEETNSAAMLCWLAELSCRRLLNRVHHVMYDDALKVAIFNQSSSRSDVGSGFQRPISSVAKTSQELNRQLETWFDLLPITIKPDLQDASTWQVQELNILLRYHSAKDIIFRPFVMYVCSMSRDSQVPGLLLESCGVCIDHCRAYIDVAPRRLGMPSSFHEIVLHSYVSLLQ